MLRDNQGEKRFSSCFSGNSAIFYSLSFLGRTFNRMVYLCWGFQDGSQEKWTK
jgi:hypothetical protein